MPQIKKLFATLFVCLCATNAWAGRCTPQIINKPNNDKYFYFEDHSDTVPNDGDRFVFVCGKGAEDCGAGTQIYYARRDIRIAGNHGSLLNAWGVLVCRHDFLDWKWEYKDESDIENNLENCKDRDQQIDPIETIEVDGQIISYFCQNRRPYDYGICVIDGPVKDNMCKTIQQQQPATPTTQPEPDCGVVGKPECDGEYKYYVCENNSNCNTDHLPPHATAGHCVSAGRIGYKVCTATACEPGFTPTGGWCQLEKKSSDTATEFSCATLKFNDGKECKNITSGVSWKANTQFQGEHKTEAYNIYFSCIDGNVAECSENLWNLNTVNGKSVTDLVKNATSLSFDTAYPAYTASENDFEIAIHDCDKENGYVPGEILHDETANNDNYITYKRCIKKSSDGGANQGTPQKKSSDPKATEVFTKLDKILDEHFTKSSVWKNDEGKFNTARLASDSIAGVVLGTVGGIVTSKLIKKNQIKNGFQDLKCTIAGQDVADYGDEFRVSIK